VQTLTTDDKSHRYLNLIGVDAATQCIVEVRVPDLTEAALATGLIDIELWYKEHKNPLTQFVLDNAAGFSTEKLQAECRKRNITVVHVTPDLHVRLAEAAIKIIKSLARTTVVDRESKGKFITSFVPHLITWIVGSINFTLRSGSRTMTPWTRFTGNKIDINIHFRVAFLDLVICNKLVQDRTNNLQSRGFVGLVVARDRSARGAFQVLNLETLKICKRYHFKLVDSELLRKYANEKLQNSTFKASYIAADGSEIATADIDNFEISSEDVAKVHQEIARLTAEKKSSVEGEGVTSKKSNIEGEVARAGADASNVVTSKKSNIEGEVTTPIGSMLEGEVITSIGSMLEGEVVTPIGSMLEGEVGKKSKRHPYKKSMMSESSKTVLATIIPTPPKRVIRGEELLRRGRPLSRSETI